MSKKFDIELYGTCRPPVRKGSQFQTRNRSYEYLTSNCMGRAVRQFEKEVGFKLGTEVGYITQNCMGRTVRQFEKEVSFTLKTGEEYILHRTVWNSPCASLKKKLVLNQEREKYFLIDSFKKACDRLALQKMATAVSVESRVQNQASKVTLQSDSNNLLKSS